MYISSADGAPRGPHIPVSASSSVSAREESVIETPLDPSPHKELDTMLTPRQEELKFETEGGKSGRLVFTFPIPRPNPKEDEPVEGKGEGPEAGVEEWKDLVFFPEREEV